MAPEIQELACQLHSQKLDTYSNKLDDYGGKLDMLSGDVKDITKCMSQIEVLLERSLTTQKALENDSAIHKEIFTALRNLTEDLTRIKSDEILALKVRMEGISGRLTALEESRKGMLGIVSPVITWAVIGLLTGLTVLFVTHGIGGTK